VHTSVVALDIKETHHQSANVGYIEDLVGNFDENYPLSGGGKVPSHIHHAHT